MNNEEYSSSDGYLYSPRKVDRRRCFLINLLYFAVLITAAVLVVRYLFVWMLPFVLAFVVAAALQNPLQWLVSKTRISKKVFSVVLVVLVILLLAGLVVVVSWQLISMLVSFVSDPSNLQMIEAATTTISGTTQNLIARFSDILSPDGVNLLQQGITNLSSGLLTFITDTATGLAKFLASVITTRFPLMLVSFIIWVIASIFLTIDYRRVVSFLMRQVPDRHKELVRTTRDLCTNTLFKLFRAYILLMFLTMIELGIGFSVLHIPYAPLVAVLVALVDILPVLGTGTILIPWALVNLAMGNFHLFAGLGILYVIVTVVRNVLEPRLVSHQIGLNPLVTLFFMFLGLRAIGIAGMLLFPVTVMVLTQLQESGRIRLWK